METNNYIPAVYSVEVQVDKKPDAAFDLIIDLRKWWPEDFEGEKLEKGSIFELSLGEEHHSTNKVCIMERGTCFAWITTESLRKSDGYDWTGTKMIFELSPTDNGTLIKFIYDGVVLNSEVERLHFICEKTTNDFLYHYLIYGKTKRDYGITMESRKPASEVFKAITEGVRKWWGGKDLDGQTTKLHDEFTIHHPGAHYSKLKVVELIPDQRIVWKVLASELSWLKQDKQEWTGTTMIFEFTENGATTELSFTHVGLTPDKECYETCSLRGWDIVIHEYLYSYLSKGKAHFD